MFFVGLRTSADLSLTTPLEFCCNCGMRRPVDLVETPLQRTRYFLFFGTELTLNETFPYCRSCKGSARRVRLGWSSKLLAACLVVSVVFLVLVLSAQSLPALVSNNLFHSSVVAGFALTLAYFYWREWGRTGSSYYQPVSLVDADISGGIVRRVRLRLHNRKYAGILAKANAELISSGMLRVEAGHDARSAS